jgi:hypothetical protein
VLAAWNDYQTTGLHLTAEEADAWLAKLDNGENVESPHATPEATAVAVRLHCFNLPLIN